MRLPTPRDIERFFAGWRGGFRAGSLCAGGMVFLTMWHRQSVESGWGELTWMAGIAWTLWLVFLAYFFLDFEKEK